MKAVNLLPPELKTSKRGPSAKRQPRPKQPLPLAALGVLGLLAAAVIAVALLTLAGNGVREEEGRLEAVKVQQQAAAAEIARLQAYGTFRQLAADRVSTVRSLAASRFDWEQALRDVSRAIPANVTLSTLTGTVSPGAQAGEASSSNPQRATREAPAIEIAGCTRDHPSVARLLARLRAVRGVTRVSLGKSEKPEGGAAAAPTTGAGPTGCGSGGSAQFEAVMFFEGATAAAVGATEATPTPTPAGTPAPGATPGPTGTPAAGATPDPAGTPAAGATPTATPAGGSAASTPTPAGGGTPE